MGKLTLKQKKEIVKVITKNNLQRKQLLIKSENTIVPHMLSASGKPIVISVVQYNELVDLADRRRKK